jgi:hypothetical protein
MTATTAARLASLSLAVALAASCGASSPTTPPPPQTGSNNSTLQLREIAILTPPSTVQIGKTETLRAVATYSDGGFVDVTKEALWSSSHEACRVSSGGSITGVSAGTAEIVATVGNVKSAPARVACGFVITITTHESAPTDTVIIPAVTGQVIGGSLAGLTFTTDENGRAVLPPVASAGFQVRLSKPGFEPYIQSVTELPREQTLSVPMVPDFGEQQEIIGTCTWRDNLISGTVPFVMRRDGKIRVTVQLIEATTLTGVAPYVRLSGDVSLPMVQGEVRSVSASLNARVSPPPSAISSEARAAAAGSYGLYYSVSGCDGSTRWRMLVEHTR